MQSEETLGDIQKFYMTFNNGIIKRIATLCHCDGKPLNLKEGDVITLGKELKSGR